MRKILFFGWMILVFLVALLWAGYYGFGPVVVTKEYEYTLILRLGDPMDPITKPGVTLRLPVIDEAITVDKRLQYLNAEPFELLVGDETLLIDYYAVWRITEPLSFRRSYGNEAGAERVIRGRLQSRVNDRISSLPLDSILARSDSLDALAIEASAALADSGVSIVDLRINRTDIPKDTEGATFDQMREQRLTIAREHRAKGEREAREIRAKANREARTLVAQAKSQSEITRGEGDAQAAAIYAKSYSAAPEFYAFVRSLAAYRKTIDGNTTMLLSPDQDFFKYFKSSDGRSGAAPAAP
jgi:membrane protease subunit HflC